MDDDLRKRFASLKPNSSILKPFDISDEKEKFLQEPICKETQELLNQVQDSVKLEQKQEPDWYLDQALISRVNQVSRFSSKIPSKLNELGRPPSIGSLEELKEKKERTRQENLEKRK
jgi:hypothetical protein